MEYSSNYESAIISSESDPQSTKNYYSQWSEKYDNDMVLSNYNGNQQVADNFLALGLDKNVKILDLLGGTGLVAQLLQQHGYTTIDAIDGCEDMLQLSKEKNLYQNYITALLGKGNPCPIESGTYDVIIGSGCFAPGHLYSDVFPELLRIVKKGGIITWVVRQGFETSTDFGRFYDDVEKLVSDGVWKYLVPHKEVDDYWRGYKGLIYVMQKV